VGARNGRFWAIRMRPIAAKPQNCETSSRVLERSALEVIE
jgi:hypothetical protein